MAEQLHDAHVHTFILVNMANRRIAREIASMRIVRMGVSLPRIVDGKPVELPSGPRNLCSEIFLYGPYMCNLPGPELEE